MKIKKDSDFYRKVKEFFRKEHSLDRHRGYVLVGLSDERYRWDLLWEMPDVEELTRTLYKTDYNDNHIDTALKSILGEISTT